MFSVRSVPICYRQDILGVSQWDNRWVSVVSCCYENLASEVGDSSGTQRKGNVCLCKLLPSNGSEDCNCNQSGLWSVWNSESLILVCSYELWEFSKPRLSPHVFTWQYLAESLLQGSILEPALFTIYIDIPFRFGINNKTCSSTRSFVSTVVVGMYWAYWALKVWLSKWRLQAVVPRHSKRRSPEL
jgi:hypothetical protein